MQTPEEYILKWNAISNVLCLSGILQPSQSRTVIPILSSFDYDMTNTHILYVILSEDKACLYLRKALQRIERYSFAKTELLQCSYYSV